MGTDRELIDYPIHRLLAQVGVNILSKSLKNMEEDGAIIQRMVSEATAPLSAGQGTAVDTKA